jgi:hypothetical protein
MISFRLGLLSIVSSVFFLIAGSLLTPPQSIEAWRLYHLEVGVCFFGFFVLFIYGVVILYLYEKKVMKI